MSVDGNHSLSTAEAGAGRRHVRITTGGLAEVQALLDKASRGDFIVRLEERLDEKSEVELLLVGGPMEFPLRCLVKQVFRSGADLHGTLVEWLDRETPEDGAPSSTTPEGATASEAEVEPGQPDALVSTSSGPKQAGDSTGVAGLTPDAKQLQVHNETRGVSLAHSIKTMNPNQKARLAAKASRQERALLLRDHTFSVQMGLLNNPRIEIKEVLGIAKNPQTTGGILKRMASDRKWISNYEIQLALVKHPGTPTPLAIRMLEQVRISDLRMLARSAALRENVRKAALRLYLKRGR